MTQEFQILRCCDCEKFQVHHVKKAKKWQCKVCGLKQSLKRAYFIGSSCDCRVNVQKLNFQAGEQEMTRKLAESCNSTDVHDINHSFEPVYEDLDVSTENDRVNENDEFENDWVDENDGFDENDWIDENDGFDENNWIDENVGSSYENSQINLEDELPRKKQRCDSYSETQDVEDENFIQSIEVLKNQKDCYSPPVFKSMKEITQSKSTVMDNNASSTQAVSKVESKQECDFMKDIERNTPSESANFKSNSILKPTHGFQLILNQAKKQRTPLSFDLDF